MIRKRVLQGDKLHLSCCIYITNYVLLLTSKPWVLQKSCALYENMKVDGKCDPKDPFGVFTNITASSVIKYNINLPSVLPSIYKGQSEVIRRKDSGSSSQWSTTSPCVLTCTNQGRELCPYLDISIHTGVAPSIHTGVVHLVGCPQMYNSI